MDTSFCIPLPAEKEAHDMIRRHGINVREGEWITPRQAADMILEFAERIRRERIAAQR